MGATVTSRRSFKSGTSRLEEITYPGASATVTFKDVGDQFGAGQETTSFRTGRLMQSAVDSDTDDDTAILSARNYSERFKALKKSAMKDEPVSSFDTGHEFLSIKREVVPDFISEQVWIPGWAGSGTLVNYAGHVYSVPAYHSNASTFIEATPPDLGWYGPRAVASTRPTAPVAELAVGLAELKREGFPHTRSTPSKLKQSIRERGVTKTVADSHLQVQFGWNPLIRDVINAAHAIKEHNKLLRQYQRDSGKNIRRSYSFPPERNVEVLPFKTGRIECCSNSTGTNALFTGENTFGSMQETITTERQVWFSGAYTYYLQQGGNLFEDAARFEQQANKLLGLRITPEVLWNLAPWSWLSDWNVNLGDNIANATALSSDGLVLRYGYLMVTTVTTHTCSVYGPTTLSGRKGPWTTSWIVTRKERFRASPYGFGSDPASYTDRQWSILGALGISKVPGHLM